MIETPYGPVVIRGRMEPGKPLLLALQGAFSERDHLMMLVDRFPHLSVAVGHLPGLYSPQLSVTSVEHFALAFDHVVDAFAGPTVIVGESIGGLVGSAMRSSHIRRRLALDSPLRPHRAWTLVKTMRHILARRPEFAPWIHSLFGVGPESIEPRDYSHLARTADTVLLASDPLGDPRPCARTPSAVSVEDREAYIAAGASIVFAPDSGHQVAKDAEAPLIELIEQLTR